MRTLRSLVEAGRGLVHDRTRFTDRITAALEAYFPQVLEWFRDKDATIFADFLERWPTLQAAQRARRETLKSFFRAGNVRYKKTIERRIDAIIRGQLCPRLAKIPRTFVIPASTMEKRAERRRA